MSNAVACQINRVKFTSFLQWYKSGFSVLKQHFFKTALITVILIAAFAGFFAVGMLFGDSYLVRVVIAIGMSLIFPLLIGAQAGNYFCLVSNPAEWSLKKIFAGLTKWNIIRLIVTYLLLALLVSLGGQYLQLQYNELTPLINIVVDILLVALQLILFIALPINILAGGKILPFKSLSLGIRAIIRNFTPALAFIFILLLLLLVAVFIALPLVKFIGIYALIVYVLEIALFLMFLGLCVTAMANDLISLN